MEAKLRAVQGYTLFHTHGVAPSLRVHCFPVCFLHMVSSFTQNFDLTEFSVSSIISLPTLLVFLLFCMFIYENHVMFVSKNCLRL